MKKILIMAGGTGGHVYPGLAIARSLQAQGVDVHWLGTERGLEARVIPEAGIPIHYLTVSGLRGKGVFKLLTAPKQLFTAIRQAHTIIQQIKPDTVLGMGGYASGPGGIAAWLNRIPLFIHEQNAKSGLTNRILARFAKHIFAAFPNTFTQHKQVTVTGNPVRADINALGSKQIKIEELKQRPLRVLIFGGSLGAQVFNDIMPQVYAQLPEGQFEIWHQTGKKQTHYTHSEQVKVVPYIDDMASAYQWADVVISRAGAATISELAATGLPSILVPYPHAVDDHQRYNAKYLADVGGAELILQPQLTVEKLTQLLTQWRANPAHLQIMADASFQQRRADAQQQIQDILLCKV